MPTISPLCTLKLTSSTTALPALFTQVFALFISDHAPLRLPGAPFLMSTALLVVGFYVAVRVTASMPRHIHAAKHGSAGPTAPDAAVARDAH